MDHLKTGALKPELLQPDIIQTVGDFLLQWHQTGAGIHGILHELSEGGDGAVQLHVFVIQGLGGEALKRVVDKVWVDLRLQGFQLVGAVGQLQLVLLYGEMIDGVHHFLYAHDQCADLVIFGVGQIGGHVSG